jgi:hypothetical protein
MKHNRHAKPIPLIRLLAAKRLVLPRCSVQHSTLMEQARTFLTQIMRVIPVATDSVAMVIGDNGALSVNTEAARTDGDFIFARGVETAFLLHPGSSSSRAVAFQCHSAPIRELATPFRRRNEKVQTRVKGRELESEREREVRERLIGLINYAYFSNKRKQITWTLDAFQLLRHSPKSASVCTISSLKSSVTASSRMQGAHLEPHCTSVSTVGPKKRFLATLTSCWTGPPMKAETVLTEVSTPSPHGAILPKDIINMITII